MKSELKLEVSKDIIESSVIATLYSLSLLSDAKDVVSIKIGQPDTNNLVPVVLKLRDRGRITTSTIYGKTST